VKGPNWLLWFLVVLGFGNLGRAPFIDWGADVASSSVTLLFFGAAVATGIELHKRGAFSEPEGVEEDESDDTVVA